MTQRRFTHPLRLSTDNLSFLTLFAITLFPNPQKPQVNHCICRRSSSKQLRAPEGRAKIRFRPETPAKPSAGLFFNGRPHLLDPLADTFFIAFHRPTGGLLWAPVHGVQQAADVIDMVANAKGALNVLGDAGTGPQISRESSYSGALEQMLFQPLALSRAKLAWPAAGSHRL